MIERFEQLLKVSKTLTVLQSEGVRDKTLAEYQVSLCGKHEHFSDFKQSLLDQGAELSEAAISEVFLIGGGSI